MQNYWRSLRYVLIALTFFSNCIFSVLLFSQDLPTITFSTLYGGTGTDDCDAVAVDAEGNTFLGCHLSSSDIPGSDKYRYSLAGNMDAFVVKLNREDNSVGFITHWGGKEWDAIQGLVSDADGNIYTVGTTYSEDIQVSGAAAQPSFGGSSDVFVSKINPKGSIVWTTYFGGDADEDSSDILLDKHGNIIIAGRTSSVNLPTDNNSYQQDLTGGSDAFIATFDPDGQLIYSTYIGGSGDDVGAGLAVDSTGRMLLSGYTNSSDFPVVNALNTELSGHDDVFVTILNAEESAVEFSTYLGGAGTDRAVGLVVSKAGDIIVVGDTSSPDLPTTSTGSSYGGGRTDVFVSRIKVEQPVLESLVLLGGIGADQVLSLELTESGKVVLVGDTTSPNFPMSYDFRAGATNKNGDGYIAIFDLQDNMQPITILSGGTAIDTFEGVAVGADGTITVSGASNSTDFPSVVPAQTNFKGGRFDILVAKFHLGISPE